MSEECLISKTKEFVVREGARGRTQIVVDPLKGHITCAGAEFHHAQVGSLKNELSLYYSRRVLGALRSIGLFTEP